MQEVIISIQPEWCRKIISGEKTLEIRKNRPDCDLPFKCYIYCTKKDGGLYLYGRQLSGLVVGEFVCDSVEEFGVPYPAWQKDLPAKFIVNSCLSYFDLHRYALDSNDCNLFAWHIKDLKLYEDGVQVNNFLNRNGDILKRAPQSWCYCIRNHSGRLIVKDTILAEGSVG